MPNSESSRSSSSRKKNTTRKTRVIKGVSMPSAHINRIVSNEKEMYERFDMKSNGDVIHKILLNLRFRRPDNPYEFWSNIHIWQDAVSNALPNS